MNIEQAQNAAVLTYLSRGRPEAPVFAAWNSIENAYYRCGCHPEIVERLWDQIGPAFPTDCRCLVRSIPTLAHSQSGVILAIGIGTQYGLRLPPPCATEAIQAGAKTTTRWSGGGEMNIQRELGEDWFFGGWMKGELEWCREVYRMFQSDD